MKISNNIINGYWLSNYGTTSGLSGEGSYIGGFNSYLDVNNSICNSFNLNTTTTDVITFQDCLVNNVEITGDDIEFDDSCIIDSNIVIEEASTVNNWYIVNGGVDQVITLNKTELRN